MDQFSSIQQTSFYEYIAFVASSMLFLVLILIGLSEYNSNTNKFEFFFDLSKLSTGITILIFIVFLMLSHIYGQFISALSEKMIGKPIKFLNKKIFKNKDFNGKFKNITSRIDTASILPDSKSNNKWTVIYFILSKNKDVGSDLLKRYAREKVARVNSLNFLILLIISIIFKVSHLIHSNEIKNIFEYWVTTLAIFILFILFCYEYFQRKSWNSDLVIKTASVFVD